MSDPLKEKAKEAFKTDCLLRLIHGGRFIQDKQFNSFFADCEELQKVLISALKTLGRPE